MIRVAVVGTGAIARSHAEGFLRFPDRCRITALVDIDLEKARKLRNELGLDEGGQDAATGPDGSRGGVQAVDGGSDQVTVLSDYRELLHATGGDADRSAGPAVDLVSICLPPSLHAEAAIAFLSHGVHVLVEKPMALSLEECDRMVAAAAESGALLSVVAQNRFTQAMWRLKTVLDTGLLGKALYRRIDSVWWRGANYYDLTWRGTWASEGGGPTLNHAVHHIDLFLWMAGVPVEVQAVMGNLAHTNSELEDISLATLRYADGSMAQITSSVIHHGEQQSLEFQGEHAMVSLPWAAAAYTAMGNGFPERNAALEEKLHDAYHNAPELPFEGHTAQVADVLQAIESGGAPLVDGIAGRTTMELITAIYKAATTGMPVKLPLGREDPFYTRERFLQQVPRFHTKTRSVESFAETRITLGRDFSR